MFREHLFTLYIIISFCAEVWFITFTFKSQILENWKIHRQSPGNVRIQWLPPLSKHADWEDKMCFCLLTLAFEYTCFSVGLLRSLSTPICTVIPILLAQCLWLQSRELVIGPAQRWAKCELRICIHCVHIGTLNQFVSLAQDIKSKRSSGYKPWRSDTLISDLLLLAMPISLVHSLISA